MVMLLLLLVIMMMMVVIMMLMVMKFSQQSFIIIVVYYNHGYLERVSVVSGALRLIKRNGDVKATISDFSCSVCLSPGG